MDMFFAATFQQCSKLLMSIDSTGTCLGVMPPYAPRETHTRFAECFFKSAWVKAMLEVSFPKIESIAHSHSSLVPKWNVCTFVESQLITEVHSKHAAGILWYMDTATTSLTMGFPAHIWCSWSSSNGASIRCAHDISTSLMSITEAHIPKSKEGKKDWGPHKYATRLAILLDRRTFS